MRAIATRGQFRSFLRAEDRMIAAMMPRTAAAERVRPVFDVPSARVLTATIAEVASV